MKNIINEFEMFQELLDYANNNGLYDTFDDLEISYNEILKKQETWKKKVKENYNRLKKLGVI